MCLRAAFLIALALSPATSADPPVNSAGFDSMAGVLATGLAEGRAAAGQPALERMPALDRAARRRAEQVAALPHEDRLTVGDPIGSVVREEGLTLYRNVALHLDMQRGYEDPAAAFLENWMRHPAWTTAMDPRYQGVGLGIARGDDGWLVLAAVLYEPIRVPSDPDELGRRVVVLVNEEREARGLGALLLSPTLVAVGRRHSTDMAERGYFGHESPDGGDVADRLRAANVPYSGAAENVFRCRGLDQPAQAAVEAWLDSPGHRDNMLDKRYLETGVGVAVDVEGYVYFTQVFVAP